MVNLRLFLLLICTGLAAPSFACAMLEGAQPKVGSTVKGPLTQVTLHFSGKIFPAKSTLQVSDAAGHVVSSGKAYGDDLSLATKVAPLSKGTYKVVWNAYCDCKSYMPGHYKFTVE